MAVALILGAPSRAHPGDDWGGWRDRVAFTVSERLPGRVRRLVPAARWPAGRYDFLASRLRVGVSVTLPHVQLVLQGQDTRLTNLPGDADALGPGALYVSHTHDTSQGEPFVKVGFVTLRRSGFAFTGGRFEYADGLVQPFSGPRDVTPRRPTCPAVGPVGIRPFIRRRFGNRFHPRWKEGSFDVQKGIARMVDRYRRAIAAEQ